MCRTLEGLRVQAPASRHPSDSIGRWRTNRRRQLLPNCYVADRPLASTLPDDAGVEKVGAGRGGRLSRLESVPDAATWLPDVALQVPPIRLGVWAVMRVNIGVARN